MGVFGLLIPITFYFFFKWRISEHERSYAVNKVNELFNKHQKLERKLEREKKRLAKQSNVEDANKDQKA